MLGTTTVAKPSPLNGPSAVIYVVYKTTGPSLGPWLDAPSLPSESVPLLARVPPRTHKVWRGEQRLAPAARVLHGYASSRKT